MQRFVTLLYGTLLLSLSTARGDFANVINVPPQTAPQEIGSDTQLNLYESGIVPDDFAAGAVDGTSSNVEVNIYGGTVGNYFSTYAGSVANVFGGELDYRFWVFDGGVANIYGGLFARDPTFSRGSQVNIFGGEFVEEVHALFRSTVNVWGGSFNFFQAHDETNASFFGTEFFVDGVELTGLVPGQPFVITDREVTFAGTLSDGTPFSFFLDSEHAHGGSGGFDLFEVGAVLSVTLVPSSAGDFDNDGDRDGADFLKWQLGALSDPPTATTLHKWEENFGVPVGSIAATLSIPEPEAAGLLMIGCVALAVSRRQGGR